MTNRRKGRTAIALLVTVTFLVTGGPNVRKMRMNVLVRVVVLAVAATVWAASSVAMAADPPAQGSAASLEGEVAAAQERARKLGQATAGTAPPPPTTPSGRTADGRICLLGICSREGPQKAPPGWGVQWDSPGWSPYPIFFHGFGGLYNCLVFNNLKTFVAQPPPPGNDPGAWESRKAPWRAHLATMSQEMRPEAREAYCAQVIQWAGAPGGKTQAWEDAFPPAPPRQ